MAATPQISEMELRKFYDSISAIIDDYIHNINKYDFSLPEKRGLEKIAPGIEGALEAIRIIKDSSLELNDIFENCPDSIYVADGHGETLRVNKAFDSTGDVKRRMVLGRNVQDLERDGLFRPSVCALVMKEKRGISLLQEMKGGSETIVSGVPVFNDEGEIYRIITNAKTLTEFKNITTYIQKSKTNGLVDLRKSAANGGIIAESPGMKKIFETIDKIIDVDTTVLLMGESGVGKGVLARYIHLNSKRSTGRLVEINCGAIPETLLESELFGYESGAFTGADRKGKPGLIEMANGGTLLLDEVSELPLMLQVKLLHFLQNRRITRVGGTKEISVDTRVIAASNKNLSDMVDAQKFRADLFYRLNVIPIEVPPLRQRPEDIEPAARFFIELYNKKYFKEFVPTKDFIDGIVRHDWPGNMRELENYIERVVVTSAPNEPIKSIGKKTCDKEPDTIGRLDQFTSLSEALEEVERRIVCSSYEKHKSSYKVAKELGISQPSAHRKIIKYIKADLADDE